MRDMKNTIVTSKQTENIQQQHSDRSAAAYHAGPTVCPQWTNLIMKGQKCQLCWNVPGEDDVI